jgi:hypothetical protein
MRMGSLIKSGIDYASGHVLVAQGLNLASTCGLGRISGGAVAMVSKRPVASCLLRMYVRRRALDAGQASTCTCGLALRFYL